MSATATPAPSSVQAATAESVATKVKAAHTSPMNAQQAFYAVEDSSERDNQPHNPVKAVLTVADSATEWHQSPAALYAQYRIKRFFDIAIALGVLSMMLPVLLMIAALIRLDSKGPVIYKSKRIGRGYKPFYMYKFRTMRPDADALRDKLRAELNLSGELFKMEDDPRITRIGKFLRATSLDELPQLLNVIIGNMSLVGPRPLPEDESAYFEAPYTVRFDVLPGITGAWQVGGRSNASFQQLCNLEYDYVKNWTIAEDARLLFGTIPAVLASRGAY
ncbi:MAG: sugar transferase [Vampirovibrionales bacterium]|nr:sugar transferase [Vampirovibrionales bacterium]